MKMLICLPDNPLQGQEFHFLLPQLESQGFQPIIHKRPLTSMQLEPLIQSINATVKVSGGGRFTILAYSWGAYLALTYLNRFPENVKGVLLVNPLLKEDKIIHKGSTVLMALPLLRTLWLKIKGRKLAAEFIKNTFAPDQPAEKDRKLLEIYLKQPRLWRAAAAYKRLMQAHPLPLNSPCTVPMRVLVGEKDKIAPYQKQLNYLNSFCPASTRIILGAGHALPWTHPQAILEEIEKL